MDRRYRNRSRSRSADKTRRSRSPIVNRSGHRTEGKPDGNWNDRRSEDSRRRGNFNRFRGDGRFDRFRRPNFNRGRFENRPERYERHNNGEKSAPLLDFTMWRSPNEGQQAVCDRDEFKNEFVDVSRDIYLAFLSNLC